MVRVLQWGRDFSAAEILLCRHNAVAPLLLQWGRDFSAAEIVGLHKAIHNGYSFNGAATFQPRKFFRIY